MKSYLSLIPISARVHKRQNRMTLFCIIIAVFLVTAVFSMADMGVRMEKISAINQHGNWHIMLQNISADVAEDIGNRSDVVARSWYNVINYKINEDYYVGTKKAAICGIQREFATEIVDCISEGKYPENDREIIISENAKDIYGVQLGDNITLSTPTGSIDYIISGFTNEGTSRLYDSIILLTDITTFNNQFGRDNSENAYYIQFNEHSNIRKTIVDIKLHYNLSEEDVAENTALLGIMGYSSNSFMMGMYMTAGVLFLLILIAGILMIAGSINSNVYQRSQFFGMLRCIGASKQQIIRIVRLEALSWCKTAIPIGVLSGVLMEMLLCAVLKFGIGGEFTTIPVFSISVIGVISGIVVGLMTVLIAAQSPARNAAKVSPVAAVMGNTTDNKNVHNNAKTGFCKIETALGVHHAISAKKNLILMTSSFALSIILFLSFSGILDFTKHAINPLKPSTPDLSVMSNDRTCSIDEKIYNQIIESAGVKRAYGRMFVGDIPASTDKAFDKIDLISYEDYQFNWAKENMLSGSISKLATDSRYVVTVYDKTNPLQVGDTFTANGATVEVAGVLSDCPFEITEGTPMIICSEKTFTNITGENKYTIIDIQMKTNATDENANAIRELIGDTYIFSDRREGNSEATGTYWAFRIMVYGFLSIIAMITVFNIINSISMSTPAKIKQYGAMRAVGMDEKQIIKMIFAEASTYAVLGCIAGCLLGIPLNRFVYETMVTSYWGIQWNIPFTPIAVILLIVLVALVVSVYTPSKRIVNMAITDTINEL